MMDLKMEVYSHSLDLLGILEIFDSVIWERKAFGTGSFSINALITDENLELLDPENIIWISGDDAGIIEYVQEKAGENGPYINVRGCDLTGILNRRILWGLYELKGKVPAIMYQLVDDCCINPTRGNPAESRIIPGLLLSDVPDGGPSIQSQKTGGTLLEALELLGEAYQVPFGVRFIPASYPTKPTMEFWARPGVNMSIHQTENNPVFYSTALDDVLSSEYSYNSQNYRNFALISGEGGGNDRVMVTVEGDVEPSPEPPTPPGPTPTMYTISLSVDPDGGGVATGGGSVESGESVTVTATAADGYLFSAWQENEQTVSESAEYTFTVSGNRALVAVFAVEQKPIRLPEGYTEIEYIESTIPAYISTGIRPTSTLKFVIDVEPTANATSTIKYIAYSARLDLSTKYIFSVEWRNGIRVATGTYTTSTNPSYKVLSSNTASRRVTITVDYLNKKAFVNGENEVDLLNTTVNSQAMGINLLCSTVSSAITSMLAAKIYSCQIWSSDEKVRDFVPCVDPSGAVGLYDLVGTAFYGNANTTGSFTAGPAV